MALVGYSDCYTQGTTMLQDSVGGAKHACFTRHLCQTPKSSFALSHQLVKGWVVGADLNYNTCKPASIKAMVDVTQQNELGEPQVHYVPMCLPIDNYVLDLVSYLPH